MSNQYIDLPVEGGAGSGVSSLNGLSGALTLVAGTGITIMTAGSNIEIISTTSGGTVTAVGLADDTGLFNITGSPVTTAGTLTLASLQNQSSNTFFAAPNGSTGAPTFRLIVPADIPTLNQNTTGTAANITATSNNTLTSLPSLSLPGSQVSGPVASATIAGNVTATSNSTLVTLSALSLPGSQLSGTVAIINGGTGQTTANAALNALLPSQTGNIGKALVTNGTNTSWVSVGGTGTVTSVALLDGSIDPIYSISGSPVTTSGTLEFTLNTQAANTVFAGPASGSPAQPTFRTLVSADIPNNAANTTGTASNITATSNSTLTTLSALTSAPNLAISGPQVSGFTQGSIIFAGVGGVLSQDNSNFYWNDTTFNLGLGIIPTTNVTIDTVNTTGASKAIQTTSYGVGSTIPFRGRFARGTIGTPTAAQSGDTMSTLSGRGYGASQFATASTGAINIVAGETFTNTSNATYLQFEVTPTGSVTLAEAMRLNSTGNLLIGTTTDSGTQKLQVNGNSNVGTVTAGVWNGTATSGQSFLTTGTTYTTPAGITTATVFKFTLIGGGGGGSSANSASTHSTTGGGGGGVIVYVTGLSPSTAYTIAIGAAGTAATSGNVGGNGGSTTLTIGATTYTASGGSAAATVGGAGGTGGTGTNGTINITGQQGGASMGVFTSGGLAGGNSPWGWGLGGQGNAPSVSGNGNPATGYGSGGGGASGNGAPTGGAGTAGCILVEWKQ